jgi:hypothetical protein
MPRALLRKYCPLAFKRRSAAGNEKAGFNTRLFRFGDMLIDRRKGEKPGDEPGLLRSEKIRTSQLPVGSCAPKYPLFSEGYFRVSGSTITNLADESGVSAAISFEDITYGFQRAYLETHR